MAGETFIPYGILGGSKELLVCKVRNRTGNKTALKHKLYTRCEVNLTINTLELAMKHFAGIWRQAVNDPKHPYRHSLEVFAQDALDDMIRNNDVLGFDHSYEEEVLPTLDALSERDKSKICDILLPGGVRPDDWSSRPNFFFEAIRLDCTYCLDWNDNDYIGAISHKFCTGEPDDVIHVQVKNLLQSRDDVVESLQQTVKEVLEGHVQECRYPECHEALHHFLFAVRSFNPNKEGVLNEH